jgi:hypothetical protein
MNDSPEGDAVKIKFHHGLGDVLMFRNLLPLLGPCVELFLHPGLGQAPIFYGEERVRLIETPDNPQEFRDIRFAMENSVACSGGAATKARICMEHEFAMIRPDVKIRPLPLNHLDELENENVGITRRFLEGLGAYALCHFQGTWGPEVQNPSREFAERVIATLIQRDLSVVVVNYDYVFHNPANRDLAVVDGNRVRSTYRALPMEFESLWTLIRRAELFMGVDSGPLHAAVCADLPCVYVKCGTNFVRNFYDEGLEQLIVIDATGPESSIDEAMEQAADLLRTRRNSDVEFNCLLGSDLQELR